MREMTTDHWIKICEKNVDRWHKRNIKTKYSYLHSSVYNSKKRTFIFQFNKDDNKINIAHSPSEFLL